MKNIANVSSPAIAVVVATKSRASEVERLIARLEKQTVAPSHLVVVGVTEVDLPRGQSSLSLRNTKSQYLLSPVGSCKQRNKGIDAVIDECDYIVFFDDDFVPSSYALEEIVRVFERYKEVVGISGTCLADGVTIGGIPDEVADELVNNYDEQLSSFSEEEFDVLSDISKWGLYGCNMAYRASAIGEARFDENLPLYGWLEDVDFSIRIAEAGSLKRSSRFAGVHQGVTHGRSPGKRLGYSQVVNPLYLRKKGIISNRRALVRILRNVAANHYKSLFGTEDWIDRKGRLRGNWNAIADVIRGEIDPLRVLKIDIAVSCQDLP